MVDAHAEYARNLGRTLFLTLASGLCGLGVMGLSGLAHAIHIGCGDTLGPGDLETLDGDLACEVSELSPAALTIEGPVTVDLGGFTISCADDGSLVGVGIDVIGSGARVHNGTIVNCDKGVVVEGDGRHRLMRVTVTSPTVEGEKDDQGIAFQVKSSFNRFTRNIVTKYAGEGFRLGDDQVPANGNVLIHNVASSNRNHAFRVREGALNVFRKNLAANNATEGFRSQGSRNTFIHNTATDNGDEGFRIQDGVDGEEAENNLLIGNVAVNNGLDPCDPLPPVDDANPGISITNRGANTIFKNKAVGNCIGIFVDLGSLNNKVVRNTAIENGNPSLPLPLPVPILFEFDLIDGNPDCDANEWRNNQFATSLAGTALNELELNPDCIR